MTAVMGMEQHPAGKTQGKPLPQMPTGTREEVQIKSPWLGIEPQRSIIPSSHTAGVWAEQVNIFFYPSLSSLSSKPTTFSRIRL